MAFLYEQGYKRCTRCEKFLITDDSRCPVCKTQLRTKPRRKTERQKEYCINCGSETGKWRYVYSYWTRVRKQQKLHSRIQQTKEDSKLYYVDKNTGELLTWVETGLYDYDSEDCVKNSKPTFPLCSKCRAS